MKRPSLTRKPAKVKGPSCNHPERIIPASVRPVGTFKGKKRAKVRPVSSKRQNEAQELARHIARFPDILRDPITGGLVGKNLVEFHHPAARRKASFLFVVPVSSKTHRRIHENPKWATLVGMLWSGRNSKVFTEADAWKLLELVPYPGPMRLAIELWISTVNRWLESPASICSHASLTDNPPDAATL